MYTKSQQKIQYRDWVKNEEKKKIKSTKKTWLM